jgi:hypothetical protein
MKPPKRSAPGREIDYRSPIPAQACFSGWKRVPRPLILARWQKHALWMLASYSRTDNFKHLEAFARHFHAMRQRDLQ